MIADPILFTYALFTTGATLFLLIYFVMTLSDLECDYLNAQECCSKLNVWVTPKLVAHSVLFFLFLITGHWLLMLCNLPLLLWMAHEKRSSRGYLGVYDPLEIHNRGQLSIFMRNVMICIGFYLIFFFIYVYCMIIACLKGNPIERSDEIIS